MTVKPIETQAYGHRFRSRLEARWAVAFTHARIDWQYELEGYHLPSGPYLPDFWLPQVSMWAEVKPSRPTDEELIKAFWLAKRTGHACLLLVGPPAAHAYWAIEDDQHWITYTVNPGTTLEIDITACDYCPFEGSDYHIDEKRFFSYSGAPGLSFPMPADPGFGPHPAVKAALSARFEHGETP